MSELKIVDFIFLSILSHFHFYIYFLILDLELGYSMILHIIQKDIEGSRTMTSYNMFITY